MTGPQFLNYDRASARLFKTNKIVSGDVKFSNVDLCRAKTLPYLLLMGGDIKDCGQWNPVNC